MNYEELENALESLDKITMGNLQSWLLDFDVGCAWVDGDYKKALSYIRHNYYFTLLKYDVRTMNARRAVITLEIA